MNTTAEGSPVGANKSLLPFSGQRRRLLQALSSNPKNRLFESPSASRYIRQIDTLYIYWFLCHST
jgi:hypothetical protein